MSETRARSKSKSKATSRTSSTASSGSGGSGKSVGGKKGDKKGGKKGGKKDDKKGGKKDEVQGTGRSQQAGVLLPVGRIQTMLKKGGYARRISAGAAVFLCGALDFLMMEIISNAMDNMRQDKKKRLRPQDIRAVFDRIVPFDEMARFLRPMFKKGGARPQIHPNLKMSMRTKRKAGKLLPAVIYDKADDDKFDYGRYQIPGTDVQHAAKLNELKNRKVPKRKKKGKGKGSKAATKKSGGKKAPTGKAKKKNKSKAKK
ncbi:uncharacterized protein LOC141849530 [Brevipalpus obovatus]|uniref:uncharacterized protein LOC141849530 n=1 Tax=Brevipalpus obovatus TaxID=246614 RepID=UPI003D9E6A11